MRNQKIIAISTAVLSLALSVGFIVFKDSLRDASALGLFGIFLINAISSATLFLASPAFLTVFTGGSVYPPFLVALVASFGFFNCASSLDWGCSITLSLMVFVLPVLAMFVCVWAIFEVFWK